jgi:hypothetical protein
VHNGFGSNSAMQTAPILPAVAGTIARVDAGQCVLRLTSARAIELEEGS